MNFNQYLKKSQKKKAKMQQNNYICIYVSISFREIGEI